jgi:peptidoglycan-associated lipoprotein
LSANTTTVQRGQGVTLTYSSTNATSVTIDQGVGAVTPVANGTRTVNPTANTTYTATATGPGGTAQSARVAITVNVPPPAQPPAQPPAAAPRPTPTNTKTPAEIFKETMVPVLFDYDKSNIRADQEANLNRMASYLKQNANIRFTIDGNADERGGQEYNIALGDDRAAAVKKYLSGQGVADARMNTVSYGEEKPVCSLQTEDCYQQNRRAGFTMMP